MEKPLLGQIGCGWVGGSYANEFEARGYQVIRYDLEKFPQNKERIKDCDIVFIAVPTPTTAGKGFDYSIVENVLSLVGKGKIAVIKSTVLPGTTRILQGKFPNITVLHSPEFLTEKTAKYDVENPARNIIGYVNDSDSSVTEKRLLDANLVMEILPNRNTPYRNICNAEEAEFTKYGGNCWFYFKVVFINLLYDLTSKTNVDFKVIKGNMAADSRIGNSHLDPVHQGGRGAGGHCFIKDMAAFAEMYQSFFPDDKNGNKLLEFMQCKNLDLLANSGKNQDLVKAIYGEQEQEQAIWKTEPIE